jgi:hypothetical protein
LVALLFGALALYAARASRDPGAGPTAASLEDAFSAWAANLLGLGLVGVGASIVSRPNWPVGVGAATVLPSLGSSTSPRLIRTATLVR